MVLNTGPVGIVFGIKVSFTKVFLDPWEYKILAAGKGLNTFGGVRD